MQARGDESSKRTSDESDERPSDANEKELVIKNPSPLGGVLHHSFSAFFITKS